MELTFQYDFEATKAALLHLAGKPIPFTKYLAVKLLFLADREHLLRFGRPITGDSYNALPFGPTPDQTLDLLDQLEGVLVEGKDLPEDPRVKELTSVLAIDLNDDYPRYLSKAQPDLDLLAETEVMVLNEVATRFGNSTFNQLKTLTHSMKAYTKAWRDEPNRRKFRMYFEDFFEDEPDKADFLKEIQAHQYLTIALAATSD